MNISYHTTIAVASACIIAKCTPNINEKKVYKIGILGISTNLILHGILDLLPHNYPLTLIKDGVVMSLIIILSMLLIKNKYRLLTLVCISGALIPDIIDKFLIRITNINVYVFPWHNSSLINKFYSIYYELVPAEYFGVANLLVIIISIFILCLYRNIFFKKFSNVISK